MIDTILDPTLIIWDEQDFLQDPSNQMLFAEILYNHLEKINVVKARIYLPENFNELIWNSMPFSNSVFNPQVRYLSEYLHNYFVKNFNTIKIVELHNCKDTCASLSPDIIPSNIEEEYKLVYKGLIVFLARKNSSGLRILSHSYFSYNQSMLEIAFPNEPLKITIRVLITDEDWDEVHLNCEDLSAIDSCTKAFGRQKQFYNESGLALIPTPSFIQSVRRIGNFGVKFEEVIEALSKLRFGLIDKGLNLEKMSKGEEWRIYVNKNRGDRIHFKYCEEGALLLRYCNPSEHDEFIRHA